MLRKTSFSSNSIAAIVVFSAMGLAACGGKRTGEETQPYPEPVVPTTPIIEEPQRNAIDFGENSQVSEIPQMEPITERGQSQPGQQQKTLYFDFDSAAIDPSFLASLDAHAEYLIRHPLARMRVEGHADERGTREYNIALGERRAQAVRNALLLKGVSRSQMVTISYGEEKPLAFGHDEAAWARNRRVELVYR